MWIWLFWLPVWFPLLSTETYHQPVPIVRVRLLLDLDLFDGYADSHFICFPYETRRTGVYACGGVRKAETMEETIDDATGAALKAIQCIESANRGVSVHPRSGDLTYPDFFMSALYPV